MKMNLKIQRKHGSTPFSVYYGRTHNICNTNSDKRDYGSWFQRLEKIQGVVYLALQKKINAYHDQMENEFNKKNSKRLVEFQVGDLVKMRNLNSNSDKLECRHKGPYRISERVEGGYNLVTVGKSSTGIVNEYPVPPSQLSYWTKVDESSLENPEYEIQRILRMEEDEVGNKLYQVKWKGYDETSWEPKSSSVDQTLLRDQIKEQLL